MRYIVLLCIMVSILIFARCSSGNKVKYNIGADVPEANKKIFIERAEKGRILFKLHCSQCHGIYTKGKEGVPDFTKKQIDDYYARAILALQTHSSIRDLTSDQLDYVLIFLRLRKIDQ